MKNTQQAASKASWGREAHKTIQQLEDEARVFFDSLKVPPEWKFLKPDRAQWGNEIYSVGAVFLDTRTRGFDVKRYRVFICSTSGKGGICEIAVDRKTGKYSLSCLISNKTAEQLNEFIKDNFLNLDKSFKKWYLLKRIIRTRK
jgi:hypothetical protein